MYKEIEVETSMWVYRETGDIYATIKAVYRPCRRSSYSGEYSEPTEPGDIEIFEVFDEDGNDMVLTEDEEEKAILQITEEQEC